MFTLWLNFPNANASEETSSISLCSLSNEFHPCVQVDQLREELSNRGMSTKGVKADLIKRLEVGKNELAVTL